MALISKILLIPAWLFVAVAAWASLQTPHYSALPIDGRALPNGADERAIVSLTHIASLRASDARSVDVSEAGHPPALVSADSIFSAADYLVLASGRTMCVPVISKNPFVAQPRAPPASL
jgi:hypothetical protein